MLEFLKKEVTLPKPKMPAMPKLPSAPALNVAKDLRKLFRWFLPTKIVPGQVWRYSGRVMKIVSVQHGLVEFHYTHDLKNWGRSVESESMFKCGSTLLKDVE